MKKRTILVIDDEKMTHVILKALLGKNYNLLFAKNAQEGIDLLAENSIHLILLDVQMPKITGIELLESLMIDSVLRSVPVIIITGKATEEIEERAKDLGATEFVKKSILFTDKEYVERLVKRKILQESRSPESFHGYKQSFKNIIKSVITETVNGDFISASRKLGVGLVNTFDINYISFWTVHKSKPNLIVSLGDSQPDNFGPDELLSEKAFREFAATKKPYMTNNPTSEKKGLFGETALKIGLSSEIGIPLFKISKEALMHNNMRVPKNTPLFGFVILKRNRVFTTREFSMISKFVIQAGTILWGLYRKFFAT